jgi:hypothetical protein
MYELRFRVTVRVFETFLYLVYCLMMLQRGPKYVGDDDDDNKNNNELCTFKRTTSAFLWTYVSNSLTGWDTRWHSWLRHCASSQKVAGPIPVETRPQYGPGFDSASNRNEYQEYFQRDKGGRCVWLTALPLSCIDCLEMWESQSPGAIGACPGQYRDGLTCISSWR